MTAPSQAVERYNVSNRLLITGKGATDAFDLRNRKVVLADDYDALTARVRELEAALRETLDALCAADTSCERVHHSKVDQHSGHSCPVERRFDEIETRARAAIAAATGDA